jgi:two-component system cell cycle response regulator DivK
VTRSFGPRQANRENTMPKVLLVEDNEENRDALSRHLRRRGYEVLIAVDGTEGIDVARAETPDLILMDMSLPVLDGWQATRQLKTAPEMRGIPIIALTAHAMAGDREKALEAGCDDYDTKPIDFPRLLAKIEAVLAKKSSPDGKQDHA